MRRHIYAAVLLRAAQAEHVVILVDGTAYRAERVMAVGEHIGDGESGQSRCTCCLDDADERDVMAGQFIEFDPKLLHVSGSIMRLEDRVCDGSLTCRITVLYCHSRTAQLCRSLGSVEDQPAAVYKICSSVTKLDTHMFLLTISLHYARAHIAPSLCSSLSCANSVDRRSQFYFIQMPDIIDVFLDRTVG